MTSAGAISRFGNRRSGLAHIRYSTELSSGGQPAGLAEGSRWSLRARGERPPESCVRERSTQEGVPELRVRPLDQAQKPVWHPSRGAGLLPAPLPGGRGPQKPSATSGYPLATLLVDQTRM